MEINETLRAKSRQEWRRWLEEHSTSEAYCWVLIGTKERPAAIAYVDAVEEALCFGWIDGTMKKTDANELAQRFSPRQKNSNWTELNKERVRRLEKLGWMTEQGRRVLPDMGPESFSIDDEVETALKQDPQVYENFMNFPELYRRIRIDTIQSYKHLDRELFDKRLEKFIRHTRDKIMYGKWHDDGRLLDN